MNSSIVLLPGTKPTGHPARVTRIREASRVAAGQPLAAREAAQILRQFRDVMLTDVQPLDSLHAMVGWYLPDAPNPACLADQVLAVLVGTRIDFAALSPERRGTVIDVARAVLWALTVDGRNGLVPHEITDEVLQAQQASAPLAQSVRGHRRAA